MRPILLSTMLIMLALASAEADEFTGGESLPEDTGWTLDTGASLTVESYSTESMVSGDYLCNLTEADVLDILEHYDSPSTLTDMEPYITAPFTCSTYGDLCSELGAARAQQYLCNRWTDARNHLTIQNLANNAFSDFDQKQEAYILQQFPNGIPATHAWWGPRRASGSPPPFACSNVDTVETATRKWKAKAFYTFTGVFNTIGGTTWEYTCSGGSCSRNYSASVAIANSYSSPKESTGGTCTSSGSASDTDGKVQHFKWWAVLGVMVTYLPEDVVANGDGGTVACKSGWWNDAGCF